MKTVACALLIASASFAAGCGEEEKNPEQLNDADLDRLRIQDTPCDPGSIADGLIHICGLSDVVAKNTEVLVANTTQGPESSAISAADGSFDVAIGGALDHVYELKSEGARAIPVVREETGTVVRGYGVGFVGPEGCQLEHWSGIIREVEGDARTRCAINASIEQGVEAVRGPVGPFELRGDTQLRLMAALIGVDNQPPRFEIDFVNDVDTFTVPVVAQSTPGQFGLTEMATGQVSPALRGRLVESMEIRSPAGSTLIVADIAFARLDPPSE